MKNTISKYCVDDVQPVEEDTKKISDKELIKNYIEERKFKSINEQDNIIINCFEELYNRGLLKVIDFLFKRLIKESQSNMKATEAFEKFYQFYWNKYKNKNTGIVT